MVRPRLGPLAAALTPLLAASAALAQAPATSLPETAATRPLEAPTGPLSPRAPRAARRPYALTPEMDAAVLATTASLWVGPEFMLRELVPLGRCPCDPAMLNGLDRPIAGLNVSNTGAISNAFTVGLLALPSVIDIFDVWRSGGSVPEWIEDTIVIGESLMVGGALHSVTRLAFQRPRPQAYGIDPGDARLGDPDTYMSFYSLSAAEVFSAAVAGAVTYGLRHPTSPWRWVYFGTASAGAVAFGLSRVFTGRHFPTDVIAAAAVGSLVGLAVPWFHRLPVPVAVGAMATPGAALVTATVTTP